MSVLQSLHDGLLRLSQLERRVDPFFRPLFDALFREQLARVVQRLINARRKRDALRIGEERESPLRPHRLRADVVELGRVAKADGPGAQD